MDVCVFNITCDEVKCVGFLKLTLILRLQIPLLPLTSVEFAFELLVVCVLWLLIAAVNLQDDQQSNSQGSDIARFIAERILVRLDNSSAHMHHKFGFHLSDVFID